jgi:hypothetical protein
MAEFLPCEAGVSACQRCGWRVPLGRRVYLLTNVEERPVIWCRTCATLGLGYDPEKGIEVMPQDQQLRLF